MGQKGAKLTETATASAAELVDALATLGAVQPKPMFGGYGVYESGVMFALVDPEGTVCFRAGPSTVGRYEAAGSKKHARMPYWAVPEAVLGDPAALREWAAEALQVAGASKRK
jgi:DNA transformation protein and related proteins